VEEHTASLQLKKQQDGFLIEGFAAAGYKNKQLRTLSQCRISCRAVTLADISTGDGRQLLHGIFDGFNPMAAYSEYTWPNQGQGSHRKRGDFGKQAMDVDRVTGDLSLTTIMLFSLVTLLPV
jgi:hypothetical protein